MPFGLTNAPATFQRLIERRMGDLNLKECLIYLDDIIIFSKTFEEHLERLEAVFQRLKDNWTQAQAVQIRTVQGPYQVPWSLCLRRGNRNRSREDQGTGRLACT